MQLLTGAGPGLMEAAARGASMAGGSVRGVALAAFGSSSSEHVHEVTEHQDLGERQSTLLGAADAYIALPGGPGTLYEVAQVLACKRVHQIDIKKPLVLVGPFFKTLLAFLDET
jgi:predicted Rossmann-fold nucleotide-binding protein